MGDSVMVAVRVRPFNKRELGLNSQLIVEMRGKTTTLTDPAGKEPPRNFTFDYSYWSFNPQDEHFVDNVKVYKDLGVYVLENAIQGYNCCLFAYGQTGSGKSYSMVGYGTDRGIVPLAMEELFKRIDANKNPHVKYLVEASMLEIYNEKVRDLFNPSNAANAAGLKVRDHPQTGPYVEGLSHNVVKTYADIQSLMDEGTRVRTVAATQMNATSSRAHTVFQIVVTATTFDEITKKSSSTTSRINLVDLAGSERVAKTGASGDQLKEGIGINQSLTALGDCIEKLAKKSQWKKGQKEIHIPYRNATLTWLLKDSLGGNSKTIMIAAISPSDDNYDESLSTLRYADRAKQIKNKAVVNEDENAKVIRQLKEEILKLKAQLEGGGGGVTVGGVSGGPNLSGMTEKEKQEYLEMKEKMRENEELMKRLNMSWEEKLKETEELNKKRAMAGGGEDIEEKRKTTPHMTNLHKDRLMSECLFYFFPKGEKVRICTKAANPPARDGVDIVLQGLQIKAEHAVVENVNNEISLTPNEGARCFINGKLIKGKTSLSHNDRVILGAHLTFRIVHLSKEESKESKENEGESEFDWDFAQKELAQSTLTQLAAEGEEDDPIVAKAKKEAEMKMKQMTEEVNKQKEEAKKEAEKKQKEFESKLKELEEEKKKIDSSKNHELKAKLAQREQEIEREKKDAEKQYQHMIAEQVRKQKELEEKLAKQAEENEKFQQRAAAERREHQLLEESLMMTIPLVNEANAICNELNQPLRFAVKLQSRRVAHMEMEKTEIMIRVINLSTEIEITWNTETLTNHLYEMREIYNNYLQSSKIEIPKVGDKQVNPFEVKPMGSQLIGSCRVYLQPCFHLLGIDESFGVIDYKGENKGNLHLVIQPCPVDEPEDTPDSDIVFEEEDVKGLKDKPLGFRFKIDKVVGLPAKMMNKVYITYQFHSDEEEAKSTPSDENDRNSSGATYPLNYSRLIKVDHVDDEMVDYLHNSLLEISVWGSVRDIPRRLERKETMRWKKKANEDKGEATKDEDAEETKESAASTPPPSDKSKKFEESKEPPTPSNPTELKAALVSARQEAEKAHHELEQKTVELKHIKDELNVVKKEKEEMLRELEKVRMREKEEREEVEKLKAEVKKMEEEMKKVKDRREELMKEKESMDKEAKSAGALNGVVKSSSPNGIASVKVKPSVSSPSSPPSGTQSVKVKPSGNKVAPMPAK